MIRNATYPPAPAVAAPVAARSEQIYAAVIERLKQGETSAAELAKITGCRRDHLCRSLPLYNLRLFATGDPCRINTRLLGNRAMWRLVPVSRRVVSAASVPTQAPAPAP